MTFGLFLDAFQRIADLATNTKGATRDIGTALTRLILRHKAIEHKLKSISTALVETFIQPLSDRIEDWKKSANTLDKDHAKGLKGTLIEFLSFPSTQLVEPHHYSLDYKKLRNDLRKKAAETVKLQKKCRKCKRNLSLHSPSLFLQVPKHDILHNKLNSTIQEVSTYYGVLEEREKQALRSAMIEERSHFCTLFSLFKPVMVRRISSREPFLDGSVCRSVGIGNITRGGNESH